MALRLKKALKFTKEGGINLYEAVHLFFQKKGATLASSSSFFALITIVPFMLLMVRGIGYFLGNLDRTQKYLFVIGENCDFDSHNFRSFLQHILSLDGGKPFQMFLYKFN